MPTADEGTITIETIINAPIRNVWKAWTEPAIILKWFGSDPGGKGLSAELDLRPGGSFQISFADADETVHTCSGVYTVVQEFSQLKFSWTWRSEPGVESFVTISLSPVKKATKMHFTHANVGTWSKHNYLDGWNATFLKLEQLLTAN